MQRLTLWVVFTFGLMVPYIWKYLIIRDDEQQVVQLEPHESSFNYPAAHVKTYIEQCVQKINFLEHHSRDELSKAKSKAEARLKERGNKL